MNKQLLRESVEIGGLLSAMMGFVALSSVWTLVYLNGGTVTVTIRALDEQFFELVMFWVTTPIVGVAFWLYLRGPER